MAVAHENHELLLERVLGSEATFWAGPHPKPP